MVRVLSMAFLRCTPNVNYGNQDFEQSPDMPGNMNDYARERAPPLLAFAMGGRRRECLNCIFI